MAKQLWSRDGKVLVSNDKRRALYCEECPCDVTPDCQAYFSWEADADDCLIITFADETIVTGGGTIVGWFWAFDDGSFSGTQNPTHTYDEDGTYNVTLTVTLETEETCEIGLEVEVCPGPTYPISCCPGIEVPETIHASITSSCAFFNGKSVGLTWNVFTEAWTYTETSDLCAGSGWGVGLKSSTCSASFGVSGGSGGTAEAEVVSCDPFWVRYTFTNLSTGNASCCGGSIGSITINYTE